MNFNKIDVYKILLIWRAWQTNWKLDLLCSLILLCELIKDWTCQLNFSLILCIYIFKSKTRYIGNFISFKHSLYQNIPMIVFSSTKFLLSEFYFKTCKIKTIRCWILFQKKKVLLFSNQIEKFSPHLVLRQTEN